MLTVGSVTFWAINGPLMAQDSVRQHRSSDSCDHILGEYLGARHRVDKGTHERAGTFGAPAEVQIARALLSGPYGGAHTRRGKLARRCPARGTRVRIRSGQGKRESLGQVLPGRQ
jgi:hypothetical protein